MYKDEKEEIIKELKKGKKTINDLLFELKKKKGTQIKNISRVQLFRILNKLERYGEVKSEENRNFHPFRKPAKIYFIPELLLINYKGKEPNTYLEKIPFSKRISKY